MPLWDDVRRGARYTAGLRDYWRAPVEFADPAMVVRQALARRQQAFLSLVNRAILANPASPYLPLLQAARLDAEGIEALVRGHGVEGTLQRLYEAGVYITLDEFKGNTPIRRGSVERQVAAADFDNPLGKEHLAGATGGTRSQGTRLSVDLADLLDEVPPRLLHMQAHGLLGRPFVMWRPAPPSLASLRIVLLNLKAGLPMLRWFSQTRPGPGPTSGKSVYLTWSTALVSRLMGHPIPLPEYVPVERAEVVARWLAEQTARGVALHVDTMVNSGVRLVKAAQALGLDIGGHTLRTGSEPLTESKAALLREAGLRVISAYGMLDSGTLGFSCGRPEAADDMHLLTYRLAVATARRHYPGLPEPIDALLLTVFAPRASKVLLNVENGDYGTLCQRRCGCPLDEGGLHQHLHTIRSFEKLSSAGMSFLGSALIDVLDVALPARFGGGPTDYQFVETEQGGETQVKLVIRPEVGALDEAQVVAFVLDELSRRSPAGRMQTEIWRSHNTLRVERAQPYLTGVAKIQTLHVERKPAAPGR